MWNFDVELDEQRGICNTSLLVVFTRLRFSNESRNKFHVLVHMLSKSGQWHGVCGAHPSFWEAVPESNVEGRSGSKCTVPLLTVSLCGDEMRSSKVGCPIFAEGSRLWTMKLIHMVREAPGPPPAMPGNWKPSQMRCVEWSRLVRSLAVCHVRILRDASAHLVDTIKDYVPSLLDESV